MWQIILGYAISILITIKVDRKKELSNSELFQGAFIIFLFGGYWIILLVEYLIKLIF